VRIATSAGTFEALVAGDESAPLVLCLHGFPDTALGWEALLARLAAAGYRAVAPYMRGYHPSTLAGPYHIDRIADDVIALADALAPGQMVRLVGHDWGALATYVALARSPGRFARAVTMAVPHPNAFVANLRAFPGQLRLSWYMTFFQLGARADQRASANDFELIERLWAQWSPGFRPSATYLAELKRCLAASGPAPFEYYRALFRPMREALRRSRRRLVIDTPVLNLHGAQDGCIDARMAARQERYFRGPMESRVLPGVGHFLHIERPDEVAALVVDWLGAGSS
jgi:pimeloyl-ACP methyl ester carboxylesterase